MRRAPPKPPPPDGYARHVLGAHYHDRDRRLRELAEAEVRRPAWQAYDPAVRAAYVRLYGRARGPEKIETWAERIAVNLAMSIRHEEPDHDAAEREAIASEAA